jgi:hypothetical protein
MLLDDLGTPDHDRVVDRERPDANRGLYLRAVDALIAWQLASRPGVLPPTTRAAGARAGAVSRLVPAAAPRRRGRRALRDTLDRSSS